MIADASFCDDAEVAGFGQTGSALAPYKFRVVPTSPPLREASEGLQPTVVIHSKVIGS
jgi:hypothetical protein